MNPKYHVGDKVYRFYSEMIIEIIRRSLHRKNLVNIQELFEEIKTYFIVEITIRKNSISYLVNTTSNDNYFTNLCYDENELFSDIETAKNIIKEIFRKELKEYQEIVNKTLENL